MPTMEKSAMAGVVLYWEAVNSEDAYKRILSPETGKKRLNTLVGSFRKLSPSGQQRFIRNAFETVSVEGEYPHTDRCDSVVAIFREFGSRQKLNEVYKNPQEVFGEYLMALEHLSVEADVFTEPIYYLMEIGKALAPMLGKYQSPLEQITSQWEKIASQFSQKREFDYFREEIDKIRALSIYGNFKGEEVSEDVAMLYRAFEELRLAGYGNRDIAIRLDLDPIRINVMAQNLIRLGRIPALNPGKSRKKY